MKTKMMAMLAVAATLVVQADTEYVGGMEWSYVIDGGKTATITGTDSWLAGTVATPSKLGGKPVAAIGERAFKGRNIIGVTIPASVTGICDSAFIDCSNLRAVKIPDSVVSIGASAFSGCSSLVCADIGKKVNAIGELAFEYCRYLDAVVFRGNAPEDVSDSAFSDVAGVCSAYVARSAKGWPAAGENWKGLPVVVGERMVRVSADIDHFNELGEECGTVAGGGEYAVGKKVTLKATPAKGCVFGGWVEHGQNDVISYSKSFAYTVDGYHTGDIPQFTARFKKINNPEDDILFVQAGNAYAWYGYVDLPLLNIVWSFSEPKVTFKGLPSGAKYDSKALKLAGQVKVPGKYKVEISVTNVSNRQPQVRSFEIEVPNYKDSEISPLWDSYGKFIPGVPVEPFTIAGGAGCKVTGLPPGMKWTDRDIMKKGTTEIEVPANSYYGTPTKPGNYTVFFSKTVDGKKHEATTTFKVGPFPKLTLAMSGNSGKDKVTGEGDYAANAKVSLKATADKGKVFSHWEEVPSGKILSYAAKFTYEMNPADTTLRGVFIAEDEDKLTSTSVGAFAFEGDTVSAARTLPAGVYLEWPIAVDATSLPTVKVSGLPTGLKFTAKDVVDSKTKAVLVPANTIYGVPTAASKADGDGKPIPSEVKVTVTTASKKTATYTIAVAVTALPAWAVGTFDGGGELGPATLSITSAGKISGKYLSEGLTWTLSAPSFDSYDEVRGRYTAVLSAKSGKEERTETVVLVSSGSDVIGGMAIASGDFGAITFVQTNWKVDPWKSIGGKIANKTFELVGTAGDLPTDEDKVTFKFAANGSVAAKGEFAAYGSTYSASASFAVIPLDEPKGEAQEFECAVVIYFPPKANKFDGFAGYTRLSWDGEKFVRCLAD